MSTTDSTTTDTPVEQPVAEPTAAPKPKAARKARKAPAAKKAPAKKAASKKAAPAAKATGERKAPKEGTAMGAALAVLKGKRTPMTPQAIYDEAIAKGLLVPGAGKTPVASLAARLAVANKDGLWVQRPAPGRYLLRTSKKEA